MDDSRPKKQKRARLHASEVPRFESVTRSILRGVWTSMSGTVTPLVLFSIDELRAYIHTTLCQRENLLQDQSPLGESPLVRGNKSCGIQFIVQGPRAVRLSAIWASDVNMIYFYDARGERFMKVPLRYRLQGAA